MEKDNTMKQGDIINCYHVHNNSNLPDKKTYFAKAKLIEKIQHNPKIKISKKWELWKVKFFEDIHNNPDYEGCWFVYPTDKIIEGDI